MQKNEVRAKAAAISTKDRVYLEDAMLDALAVEEYAAELLHFCLLMLCLVHEIPRQLD